jgi:hypothetical protein
MRRRVSPPRLQSPVSTWTVLAHPAALGDQLQVAVQGVELTVEPVEMREHLAQRLVRERVIETLTGDPRSVHCSTLNRFGSTRKTSSPCSRDCLSHGRGLLLARGVKL